MELPVEIVSLIFSWLSISEILAVREVCILFWKASRADTVWERPLHVNSYLCREKFEDQFRYREHFFQNRMFMRYCRLMGCDGELLKGMPQEKALEIFTYHLLMGNTNLALVSTTFPIKVRWNKDGGKMLGGGYHFHTGCFIGVNGHWGKGRYLWKPEELRPRLRKYLSKGYRMRTADHHLTVDGDDVNIHPPKIPLNYDTHAYKKTYKLYKFGFLAESTKKSVSESSSELTIASLFGD